MAAIAVAVLFGCSQLGGPGADASPSDVPSSQTGAAVAVPVPAPMHHACGACMAGALRLEIDADGVALGGQKLPPEPNVGHLPSVDPAALAACLKQCPASTLAVSAKGSVSACLVGHVLRIAAANTVRTATLEVDGRQAGTYPLVAAKADLQLTSMACGAQTNASAWIRDVARLDGVTAPKNIELTVNYSCTLRQVMPTLRALRGKGLAVSCHMGPY